MTNSLSIEVDNIKCVYLIARATMSKGPPLKASSGRTNHKKVKQENSTGIAQQRVDRLRFQVEKRVFVSEDESFVMFS